MTLNFTYITTTDQLARAMEFMNQEKVLAIDLECENNLHHYGAYISLIQISSKDKNVVIDVLALPDIKPVIILLENPHIQKIFHDVSFDLRILNDQFHCQVKNIFDTQLAALMLGKEKVGLCPLLEEYFSFSKEKKFQRVDWTRRPLSKEMLAYAVGDTAYLLQLKNVLETELEKLDRLQWIQEESINLGKIDFLYKEQDYLDISGAKLLPPKELAIFHALFDERRKMAQKVDKPAYMVFRNQQLLAFAQNPPRSWTNLRGVHPIVRQKAKHFSELAEMASKKEELVPKKLRKRLTLVQAKQKQELTELRNKTAEKLGIKGHLLLGNDQVIDVVVNNSLDSLRPWQKELVKEKKLIKVILQKA